MGTVRCVGAMAMFVVRGGLMTGCDAGLEDDGHE